MTSNKLSSPSSLYLSPDQGQPMEPKASKGESSRPSDDTGKKEIGLMEVGAICQQPIVQWSLLEPSQTVQTLSQRWSRLSSVQGREDGRSTLQVSGSSKHDELWEHPSACGHRPSPEFPGHLEGRFQGGRTCLEIRIFGICMDLIHHRGMACFGSCKLGLWASVKRPQLAKDAAMTYTHAAGPGGMVLLECCVVVEIMEQSQLGVFRQSFRGVHSVIFWFGLQPGGLAVWLASVCQPDVKMPEFHQNDKCHKL
eukprot:1147564-Pelagomonas_calceolata.AAC.7